MRRVVRRLPIEVWMIVKDPDALIRARRKVGFTQTDLANLVGVTQQYISVMETGMDRDCSDRVATRIARYVDRDVEDLFTERSAVRAPRITTRSRVSSPAA